MVNTELIRAEYGVTDCSRYQECKECSSCSIELSSITPGAERRGSRSANILLVTEAPDQASSLGTPYKGGISNRIISIFTEKKYGIGLKNIGDSFSDFLYGHDIYATSAIKCVVDNSGKGISNKVIDNCREEFLTSQINAFDDLKIIIPMGKVATASILNRTLSSITLTEVLGKRGQGILTQDHGRDPPVIVFPHPSGASPLSNPPIRTANDSKSVASRKMYFRQALTSTRKILERVGYDVLDDDPDCWDSTGGFSSFV